MGDDDKNYGADEEGHDLDEDDKGHNNEDDGMMAQARMSSMKMKKMNWDKRIVRRIGRLMKVTCLDLLNHDIDVRYICGTM